MIGFNLLMVMAGVMALSAVSRLGRDYFSQTSTPIALQLGNSALDHLGWGHGDNHPAGQHDPLSQASTSGG